MSKPARPCWGNGLSSVAQRWRDNGPFASGATAAAAGGADVLPKKPARPVRHASHSLPALSGGLSHCTTSHWAAGAPQTGLYILHLPADAPPPGETPPLILLRRAAARRPTGCAARPACPAAAARRPGAVRPSSATAALPAARPPAAGDGRVLPAHHQRRRAATPQRPGRRHQQRRDRQLHLPCGSAASIAAVCRRPRVGCSRPPPTPPTPCSPSGKRPPGMPTSRTVRTRRALHRRPGRGDLVFAVVRSGASSARHLEARKKGPQTTSPQPPRDRGLLMRVERGCTVAGRR